MKTPAALPLALALSALAACSTAPITQDTRSFDWLTGCWQQDRPDGFVEEIWLAPAANGTLGLGREVRNGKTVSWEFMRIELRATGELVFIAQPQGQAMTEFRVAEHAPGVLAFENPAHDFPTRVEYRYVDLNTLQARISGTVKGRAQAVEYPMERVACDG